MSSALERRLAGIVKCSQHGLGQLLNPIDPESEDRDWIRASWRWLLASDTNKRAEDEPPWFERPALVRIAITSPELLRPFRFYNDGKNYDEQVRPFGFLLSAQVTPFGYPNGSDPDRFHLVARYEKDPAKWLSLDWIERYSGEPEPVNADETVVDQ